MSRPAVQQFAGHYVANMRFAVVPLDPRSKGTSLGDWPNRTFGPDDFAADANIGIRSVGGLVVVDDDFKTTDGVACMDHFLPATGAAYGRGPFRRRKRLYRCPALTKTITFKDIDGCDLLQLRVGLQDMCPPSVHPAGETLTWDGLLLPPSEVGRDELVAAARLAWTARLIAKYWPDHGRHELRLAYARVLLDLDLSVPVVTDILEWACRLGGSDHHGIAAVQRAVESTRARLDTDEPTKGGQTIADHLPAGRVLVRLLRKTFGVDALVLNPNDPLPSAREFVRRLHTVENVLTLRHHQSVFLGYDSGVGAYAEHDEPAVRAALYRFLEQAYRPSDPDSDDDERVRFQPTQSKVANVADPLRALCNLPASYRAPCWLTPPSLVLDPFDILACPTGLLHIPTRTLYPPSPHFFTLNGIDFPYNETAPEPTEWLAFLRSLWPDDAELAAALQEIFGYVLTPDTRQQKIFMLVGPPRSGKGIIGRVLRCLVGDRNVCSPTLASFGRDFGKQVLVGKTLALISDARISGRTDTAVLAETLLSISGEDAQTVERKFLPAWNGKLAVRFILLTNELPRLGDVSGALTKRFVVLPLTESFYGREDLGLFDRLVPELPSILNWALAGRDRLVTRGYFAQPTSANDLIQDFADLASPEATFLRGWTRREHGATVSHGDLFRAWQHWAAANGRDHAGSPQTFGRNVRAALPWVTVKKFGGRGAQERHWEGLRLVMPGTDDRPDFVGAM